MTPSTLRQTRQGGSTTQSDTQSATQSPMRSSVHFPSQPFAWPSGQLSSQSSTQPHNANDPILSSLRSHDKEMKKVNYLLRAMYFTILRLEIIKSPEPEVHRIKYALDEPSDKTLIKQITVPGIIEIFRTKGFPYDQIAAIYLGPEQANYIFIFTKTSAFADKIRSTSSNISKFLGLSVHCHVKSQQYIVEARSMLQYRLAHKGLFDNFAKPERFIPAWSRENNVSIRNAQFKMGKLWSRTIARDLAAFPKFCYNCYDITHLKDECIVSSRCGLCARDHHTSTCEKNDPAMARDFKCVNCLERPINNHQAWSKACTSPRVVKMRTTCEATAVRGPPWAPKNGNVFLNASNENLEISDDAGDGIGDYNETQPLDIEQNPSRGKRTADGSDNTTATSPKRRSSRLLQRQEASVLFALNEEGWVNVEQSEDENSDIDEEAPISPCITVSTRFR
ncbi:hypothetical protein FGRMN_5556 [Fusarium graminum]|nr:hypothetical protein FGRMN_5556 [Fusarium graminum]